MMDRMNFIVKHHCVMLENALYLKRTTNYIVLHLPDIPTVIIIYNWPTLNACILFTK